jgi:hypothetical protein
VSALKENYTMHRGLDSGDHRRAWPGVNPVRYSWLGASLPACLALVFIGCGNTPPPAGSPVTTDTATNSLPAPPPQADVNRYVTADVGVATNAVDLDLWISHQSNNYNYQQLGAAGTGTVNVYSGGIFTDVSDVDYLAETDRTLAAYTFAGFAAENKSDVSLLAYGYGGGPYTPDFEIGVPVAQNGCVAPSGTVPFTFLRIPVSTPLAYTPGTDSLYGSGKLTYKKGAFSYSGIQEFAIGGGSATSYTVPFADSYCVQSFDGYAIEAASTNPSASEQENMAIYLGPTGTIVGTVNISLVQPDGTFASAGRASLVGVVQASSQIDMSKASQGTYKGFNLQPQSGTPANPAYFGTPSTWITSPVFTQTSGSLVGGFESPYNVVFSNPPPQVTGNILITFGAQDSGNPGLFPSAQLTEPDPSSMCPPAQQSTGSDGNTYCTFPVVALIEQSYSKYVVFIAGPEPTTGQSLFYALVQD